LFRISERLIDPDTCEITYQQKTIKVSPLAMSVLIALIERAGRVVEAEFLLESCWDISYPTDNSLHKTISELRSALDDRIKATRIIKTVPKRGYTLKGKVVAMSRSGKLISGAQHETVSTHVDATIQTGHEALEARAYDLAQRYFLMALERLQAAHMQGQPVDQQVECDLMLLIGKCCLLDQGTVASKPWFLDAEALASQLQYGIGFAGAVLGKTGNLQPLLRSDREEVVAQLSEALTMVQGQSEILENRLKSRLLSFQRPITRIEVQQAAAMVSVARALSDPTALLHALVTQHELLAAPSEHLKRMKISAELVALAPLTVDRDMATSGFIRRCSDLLESGQLAGVLAAKASLEALEPAHLYRDDVSRVKAMVELMNGNVVTAENQALAIAVKETGPLFIQILQLFHIRRLQGRTIEMLPLIESLAAEYPDITAIKAHLALGYVETGQLNEAKEILSGAETLLATQDISWRATLAALAETAFLTKDQALASVLINLLKPYASKHLVQGAACYLGATDYFLGQLYVTTGQLDLAYRSLLSAVEQHSSLKSIPMQLKSLMALSRLTSVMGNTVQASNFLEQMTTLYESESNRGWGKPNLAYDLF